MMRKFLVRPSLVDERTKQRQLADHHSKLRHATHAIDCLSPPTYSHLTLKLKKLQLEHERVWQIENENRRLLSRLAEIMNRARVNCKSRFSVYNTKRFGGGAKIRPTSQPRVIKMHQHGSTSRNAQQDEQDSEWKRNVSPRRPHTVAVMARNATWPPATGNNDSLNSYKTKKTKTRKSQVLCGCASRQPLPLSEIKALPDTTLPKVRPPSPVNDVTDLSFGIQKVQITVKQQSTD